MEDSSFMMEEKQLILASASPRRTELLRLLGLPFCTRPTHIEESKLPDESPQDYVRRMAFEKGKAHSAAPNEFVLSADTIVELDGVVLGKPLDLADGERILKQLRARTHKVHTALTLQNASDYSSFSDSCETLVPMRDYSDDEIHQYLARDEYLDKAGSYAIQDSQFHPVTKVEGCYANVMGLPLCHVYRLLKKAGLGLDVDIASACQRYNHITCEVFPLILQDIDDEKTE